MSWQGDNTASPPPEQEPGQEDRRVAVLEALGHHQRLVLLGAPGPGKHFVSCFCPRLLFAMDLSSPLNKMNSKINRES